MIRKRKKKEIVNDWMQGNPSYNPINCIPVKDFMQKILSEAMSAYYSHPTIWSDIGYAGPAYPRGYVRSEIGLTDPWEAKRDGK